MTRALRAFGHVVRADFLERVRRHGFLVTLAVTLGFAYLFLPPNDAGYTTFQVGNHRGLYGSAWVGAATAMLGSTFLSLIGFYLVKNAVERDRMTGVGQILATTPLSKPLYTLGKAASNLAVLATLMLLLAAGALGMQLLRGEDTRVDVLALIQPFLVVTLPALVVASAIAVTFESVRWLRGGFGNVVYFFLWTTLVMSSISKREDTLVGIGDFLGSAALLPGIIHDIQTRFPGAPHSMSIGFQIDTAHRLRLDTFDWPGPHWSAQALLGRVVWIAMGIGLALAAAIPFDRFDTARAERGGAVGPRRGLRPWHPQSPSPPPTEATVPAWDQRHRPAVSGTTLPAHLHAADLPIARRATAPVPLLRGELALMLGRQPWVWRIPAVGLAVACWLAPLKVAREILLPLAWIWPLLLWSPMGAREAIHRTEGLMFSSPRPLARQLAACWTAGLLVAVAMGLGVGVRLVAAGDGTAAIGWAAGAALIPTLALACGVWTGNGRLFEVLYLLLWYLGPMNKAPVVDFAATQAVSATTQAVSRVALAALAFGVVAVAGRARALRR